MADSLMSSLAGGLLGRMIGPTADSPQGGLAAASAREELPQVKMPESPEAARQDYYVQINKLRTLQDDLLRSLEQRAQPNASDTLFAISRGLLAPNPTGQFGAAFGNAVGELQGQQARQEAAAQQLAKMRLEMGQSQLGMAEKGIALAQEQQRINALKKLQPGATPTVSGISPQAAQSAASSVGLNIPSEAWPLIEGMDSKQAIETLTRFMLKNAETPDAIKAAHAWANMLPPKDRDAALAYLAKRNIEGETKLTPTYLRELGGTYELSQRELDTYLTTGVVPQRLSGRIAAPPGVPSEPPSAPSQGATTSTSPRALAPQPSQEQLSAQKAGVESEARTKGTEAAKAFASMMQKANLADSQIAIAERLHAGAENFPDVFGVLSKAGLFPALVQLARDSKVPFIPRLPPNIEARIVQITPIPRLQNETDAAYAERKNRRIEALMMGAADVANLELTAAQTQRGLGALTDAERKIISQSITSTADPARVLQAKAALQKATAQLNQETRTAYQEWATQPGNRMKSFYDFESSSAAKQIIDKHNARAKAIYDAYFPAPTRAAPSSRSGTLVDQFRATE